MKKQLSLSIITGLCLFVPFILNAQHICVPGSLVNTSIYMPGAVSSSAPGVASVSGGTITGVSAGTSIITFSSGATSVATVEPTPVAIMGPSEVCIGSTTSLTDATAGFTWLSSNPSVATINPAGALTGVALGVTTITYQFPAYPYCSVSKTISVDPLPAAPDVISGTDNLCQGGYTLLGDVTIGGAWSSSAAGIASISSTGSVSGVTGGVAIISYTMTNGCGSLSSTMTVTVNLPPTAPDGISGTAHLNVGATSAFSDMTSGGLWSSSLPAIATVDSSGIVTGIMSGTSTIRYTMTNGCGSVSATRIVTVEAITTAIQAPGRESTVEIFPNPANDLVNIQCQRTDEIPSLSITDMTGREVYRASALKTGPLTINLADQPAGVYIVTIKTQAVGYRQKLTLQK